MNEKKASKTTRSLPSQSHSERMGQSETLPEDRFGILDDDSDSIALHLDMLEDGPNRGDEVLHQHGSDEQNREYLGPLEIDKMLYLYNQDLSEANREGDEMSGDDHSRGLQGGEPDLKNQSHFESGLPGEELEDQENEYEAWERKRASGEI